MNFVPPASLISTLVLLCCFAAGSAAADDGNWSFCRKPPAAEKKEESKSLEVPGGNIFGFTDPSDIGSSGDCGFSIEYTGRAGKRHGTNHAGTAKFEFAATLTDRLAVAASPFLSWYRVRDNGDATNHRSLVFDGLSTEIFWRFLERSAENRLAATFAVEPRWARSDFGSGERAQAYGPEFKLLFDAPLSENFFVAVNLNYALGWQKLRSERQFARGSGTNLSAALSWGPDGEESVLLLGVEVRWLTAFEGLALNRHLGQALFVGPSLTWNVREGVQLMAAWTPQLAGSARGVEGRLDLENFRRHQLRLFLGIAF